MTNDFEKIASSLRMHFCPVCKASFGCEVDEDQDCDCIGEKYAADWRKPWCPNCHEQRAEEDKCRCLTGRMTSGRFHNPECRQYDGNDMSQQDMRDYIQGLTLRDLGYPTSR